MKRREWVAAWARGHNFYRAWLAESARLKAMWERGTMLRSEWEAMCSLD